MCGLVYFSGRMSDETKKQIERCPVCGDVRIPGQTDWQKFVTDPETRIAMNAIEVVCRGCEVYVNSVMNHG